MFQTASRVCRPGNALRSIRWSTTAAGCWFPPSTTATRVLPMKYSQLLVRCRAVNTQVNVTVRPTDRTGQARLLSFSTEN
jgi:hypothetical protein